MAIAGLLDWFAGNGRYMTLVHCMGHDWFWIGVTVLLDLVVATGYLFIALHWRRNEATVPPSPAKSALGTMKNIFVFCGICGYLFIPVKMFWPAWRLYDGFLLVLAYFTWRYASSARHLRVVYSELGRSAKLAKDLERSREEAQRKSYFLNAISHDLKTPLNGLMLQAELAELSCENLDPEPLREALAEIKACARTTADLLNRFLEIGRLDWSDDPTRVERFELADLISGVAATLRVHAAQKGLSLVCDPPPALVLATDRHKLERILFNLVDNAIKFTCAGEVRIVASRDTTGVRIAIMDTGEGISSDDQSAIFDDFVQVHNRERDSRKGFGLGLAIARRLARQIGGEIVVDSELGRGSRFVVSLPAAAVVGEGVDGGAEPRPVEVAGSAAVAHR
jgi:signal transduction histidine kinase